MNDLNSVLMQGEIVDDSCILIYDDRLGDCTQFGIKCTQTFQKAETKYIYMDVIMQKSLAERHTDHIREKGIIRIIGRLWTDDTRTLILADDLQFMPK